MASAPPHRTRLYLNTSQWLQLTVTVVGQTIYWPVFRRSMTRHVFRTINCLRYVVPNDSSSLHSAYNPVRLPWFIPLLGTSCPLFTHTKPSQNSKAKTNTRSNETPRRHTVNFSPLPSPPPQSFLSFSNASYINYLNFDGKNRVTITIKLVLLRNGRDCYPQNYCEAIFRVRTLQF